jgi:glycerate 2-kinase
MKSGLTAYEIAQVMQAVIVREAPAAETIAAPIADGGNGTLDCILTALGGEYQMTLVHGPLTALPIPAQWGIVEKTATAIIEMAEAAGLHLLHPDQYDAMHASTYGVGELISTALSAGCTSIILGIGGSATNDGGVGCMEALGVKFLDKEGKTIPPGGAGLRMLDRVDARSIDPRLARVSFTVLTDVRNPLCGPDGASYVFGPQKGATPGDVHALDEGLRRYASILRRDLGRSVADIPGAGAGGGFGAGLFAFCNATIVSGIDYVLDLVDFDALLHSCDAVFTAEGQIDSQTGSGKGIAGICDRASHHHKPVHAFVGRINGDPELLKHRLGLSSLTQISPPSLPTETAILHAKQLLDDSVTDFLSHSLVA